MDAAEEKRRVAARMSAAELADSLIFYRRRLAERIILHMIDQAPNGNVMNLYLDPAFVAEDLAHAIAHRLAARETGDPDGYK